MGTILGVILGVVILAVAIFVFIKLRKKPTPAPTPVPVVSPVVPVVSPVVPVVSPVVPDSHYYYRATKYVNCQQEPEVGNIVVRSTIEFDNIHPWFVDQDAAYLFFGIAYTTTYDIEGEFTSLSCNG